MARYKFCNMEELETYQDKLIDLANRLMSVPAYIGVDPEDADMLMDLAYTLEGETR